MLKLTSACVYRVLPPTSLLLPQARPEKSQVLLKTLKCQNKREFQECFMQKPPELFQHIQKCYAFVCLWWMLVRTHWRDWRPVLGLVHASVPQVLDIGSGSPPRHCWVHLDIIDTELTGDEITWTVWGSAGSTTTATLEAVSITR